ncbi:4'-phosphopantetheinyl transferase superfamily protein [soil metagenome]
MTESGAQTVETQDDAWHVPREFPSLARNEVHVWRIDLPGQQDDSYEFWLSPDERTRAAGFRVMHARRWFIVTRAVLRMLLARYLGTPLEDLPLRVNAWGKPQLVPESTDLHFNVSHTRTCALIAMTRQRRVGIDVECSRRGLADMQIAEHFFAPEETAALRALPAGERAAAFFNCWTRKEAWVKAVGRGLSIPLDAFVVSIGEAADLLEVRGAAAEAARWTLRALHPDPDHIGALAVEGHGWRLRQWQWPATLPHRRHSAHDPLPASLISRARAATVGS